MADETILIVDDEEELAENLADLLEFEGYGVTAFSNAEDALENCDVSQLDLALLDYQLPGMSGIDLLQRLKEKRPDLPAFMISTSSQPGTREEAALHGANGFILKPYDQDELLKKIRETLRE